MTCWWKNIRIIFIALLFPLIIIVVGYIYLICFHRVSSTSEISSILYVTQLPVVNFTLSYDRCRLHKNEMVSCLPNTIFIGVIDQIGCLSG